MQTKYYLDTVPLGSGRVVVTDGAFFARAFPIPDDVAVALIRQRTEFAAVQEWLIREYDNIARRDYVPVVPDEIKEILCLDQPKDAKPKKQASARPSKKKSPTKRKTTASSSTTNQKEA